MKAYRVTGTAPFGSQRQEFSYDFPAEDAEQATAKTYSIIGSRHRAKRRKILIADVSEIDPRISTDPQILHAFRDHIAAAGGLITEAKEEE